MIIEGGVDHVQQVLLVVGDRPTDDEPHGVALLVKVRDGLQNHVDPLQTVGEAQRRDEEFMLAQRNAVAKLVEHRW